MKKQTFFSLIFLLIATIAPPSLAQPITHGSIESNDLLTIPLPIPTVTQLQFYLQAVAVGKNPTTYRIANSSITNQSPTRFGFLDMFDNLLTTGPQPTSSVIGRTQGLLGSSDLEVLAFFTDYNVVFTSGPYNGSTLNIVGRVSTTSTLNELSVAGGTQFFRLAKGIVTLRDVTEDLSILNAILQLNLTVYHYPTL